MPPAAITIPLISKSMKQVLRTVTSRASAEPSSASAHPGLEPAALNPHRWLILWTLVAAQFMFVVDAFIVNVALPTIRTNLRASAAELEAVLALYLLAYATLVIIGGRLGDIYGVKRVFLVGLIGFTLASVWCGLARSGLELTIARLVQGATAALMVPQVLASIHVLFPGAERARAFGAYGIALGFGGAVGFVLGGFLVTLNLAGLGWRTVFFVNAPVGLAIAAAATRLMASASRRSSGPVDVVGAAILFAGLLCVVGPLLFGRDVHWAPWLWLVMSLGLLVIAGFLLYERRFERRGGVPLVASALLGDTLFLRGLAGAFCFFSGNLSFYLVTTLFLQGSLGYTPWEAGLIVLPLAFAFVAASRRGTARSARRGVGALLEGCVVQMLGLGGLATLVLSAAEPGFWPLTAVLAVFGYGQGLVMAPLSSAVLANVRGADAGSASGMYATAVQIANAVGVAAMGALFFTVEEAMSGRAALLAAVAAIAGMIALAALFLRWMRRSPR